MDKKSDNASGSGIILLLFVHKTLLGGIFLKSEQNINKLSSTLHSYVEGWVHCRKDENTQYSNFEGIHLVSFGKENLEKHEEFLFIDKQMNQAFSKIENNLGDSSHFISVISTSGTLPDGVTQLGYRYLYPEVLMEMDLAKFQAVELPKYVCKRVVSRERAEYINQLFEDVVVYPSRVEETDLHTYVVEINQEPIAHGRFSLINGCACLVNMFTRQSFRGQGVAKSLCIRMLEEAKSLGATKSYLMSNDLGHRLYRSLGYQDLARVYVYQKDNQFHT